MNFVGESIKEKTSEYLESLMKKIYTPKFQQYASSNTNKSSTTIELIHKLDSLTYSKNQFIPLLFQRMMSLFKYLQNYQLTCSPAAILNVPYPVVRIILNYFYKHIRAISPTFEIAEYSGLFCKIENFQSHAPYSFIHDLCSL